MRHAPKITARTLAAQWRANPADRPRIEREIAEAGRADEFTHNRWGELIAHVAPRPVVGESFRSLNLTPLSEMLTAEQIRAAGMGFQREAHTGLIHMGEAA